LRVSLINSSLGKRNRLPVMSRFCLFLREQTAAAVAASHGNFFENSFQNDAVRKCDLSDSLARLRLVPVRSKMMAHFSKAMHHLTQLVFKTLLPGIRALQRRATAKVCDGIQHGEPIKIREALRAERDVAHVFLLPERIGSDAISAATMCKHQRQKYLAAGPDTLALPRWRWCGVEARGWIEGECNRIARHPVIERGMRGMREIGALHTKSAGKCEPRIKRCVLKSRAEKKSSSQPERRLEPPQARGIFSRGLTRMKRRLGKPRIDTDQTRMRKRGRADESGKQESRKRREPAVTPATTNALPFSCFPAFLIHLIRVPSVFICGFKKSAFHPRLSAAYFSLSIAVVA
jgi:hypothetical protein